MGVANALVTAIIGEKHRSLWETHARESWQRYAARHGYEIVLITEPLDKSEFGRSRHVAWQKLLLFSLPGIERFERVAWVDSDIIINAAMAPDLFEGVPAEILNPRNTWEDPAAYDKKAQELVKRFIDNFAQFEEYVDDAVRDVAVRAKTGKS